MIRFALVCDHDHSFEGWFRSGEAFDEQAAGKVLACPFCGSNDVRKGLMAPAITRRRGKENVAPSQPTSASPGDGAGRVPVAEREAFVRMVQLMRAVRQHVETNFEDVGERFPQEVRAMHLGEAEQRDVYGLASTEEVRSLFEDGIEVVPLPLPPKLDG